MFLKTFLIILILNIHAFSCAGGWDFNQKEFIFLEKRDAPFSNISEDIKAPEIYNTIIWRYEEKNKEQNLLEWQKEFNDKFSKEQIEKFLYKRENLELIKNKEIVDYINFVKTQEEYVIGNRYYYFEKKKETKNKDEIYKELINQATNKIQTINSSYLKLRYFYLALRLAHFKKQNPLDIYEKYSYLLNNDKQTIVKDWITALYAGALIKNQNIVPGIYEFTKLFDKDKINWHLSYYNFHHLKTNEQWEELLKMAKNSDEKAKFYALRTLNYKSNTLEELDNIYKIDKNSKWFDFILYRKLLDTQHFFDQNPQFQKIFPFKKYISYLKDIQKDDMYLIELSLAYFNLYEKDFNEASKYEKILLENYPNAHEVKTFSYILYLEQLKTIDLKTENEIYEKMQNLTKDEDISTSIHDYTFVVLEKLYEKKGDKFKAFLSKNINYLYEATFTLPLLIEFENFMKNKKASNIEEHFAKRYLKQQMIKESNNKIVLNDNLLDAKTKLFINNLEFKKALETNSKYLDKKLDFNPFNSYIRGNNREGKNNYTLKEFLNKLLEIQNILEKNPTSTMDNYLYANALYNLSYFGNSNIITTIHRSVYSFNDLTQQNQKLTLSEEHYLKALNNSNKKEFKAKIVYMLSKVELAKYDVKFAEKSKDYYNNNLSRFYLNRSWGYKNEEIYTNYVKNDYGKYFDMLKNNYENSNYYKEVLQECGNLKFYQKQKEIYK